MKTEERSNDAVNSEDDLLRLQLQVARRADELAQSRGRQSTTPDDWEYWLEAERQVLSHSRAPVLV
jgi:hypothetical protein